MILTKSFCWTASELSNEINDFFRSHPNYKYVDIKVLGMSIDGYYDILLLYELNTATEKTI